MRYIHLRLSLFIDLMIIYLINQSAVWSIKCQTIQKNVRMSVFPKDQDDTIFSLLSQKRKAMRTFSHLRVGFIFFFQKRLIYLSYHKYLDSCCSASCTSLHLKDFC